MLRWNTSLSGLFSNPISFSSASVATSETHSLKENTTSLSFWKPALTPQTERLHKHAKTGGAQNSSELPLCFKKNKQSNDKSRWDSCTKLKEPNFVCLKVSIYWRFNHLILYKHNIDTCSCWLAQIHSWLLLCMCAVITCTSSHFPQAVPACWPVLYIQTSQQTFRPAGRHESRAPVWLQPPTHRPPSLPTLGGSFIHLFFHFLLPLCLGRSWFLFLKATAIIDSNFEKFLAY